MSKEVPDEVDRLNPCSPIASVTIRLFCGSVTVGSGAPVPSCWTWSRAICVQTAVKSRKAMQQERRSIAGTTLITASSAFFFFFPCPPSSGIPAVAIAVLGARGLLVRLRGHRRRHLHLVLVRDDEVQHRDGGLVD